MFEKRKDRLFETPRTSGAAVIATENPFVKAAVKKAAETRSGNDSLKYTTTGNEFVDQFGKISQYLSPRPYSEVDIDMRKLWSINSFMTIALSFFIRMITRVVVLFDNTKTNTPQRGAGLKHEGMLRMIWLHLNYPQSFWKNISLYISIGSWKDIFDMLRYDLEFNGWDHRVLDWNKFYTLILAGLENPNTTNLVKKYLPQITAKSKCTTVREQANTLIAKWLAFNLKLSYKQYRLLKTSGTAHTWQQLISKKLFDSVDFNSIHGRALSKLVSSKFLKNHGLESKYQTWIETQPVAKFTGYVYELAKNITNNLKPHQKMTINKQYETLLALAKVNTSNSPYRPIGVLDSSGSMSSMMYIGNGKIGKLASIDVAFPLVIMLDDMLPNSPFKGYYLGFHNDCIMHKIHGDNFVDKIITTPKQGWGGTDFMSIFRLFIDIKHKTNLDENNFPNMIVCFSDGEFNSVGHSITNVELGRKTLVEAGFSKEFADSFGFCFVDMPNTFYGRPREPKFETFGNIKNVFYFSGYDLSPLGFLFGQTGTLQPDKVPTTAEELFKAAINQEIFNKIEI